MHACNDFCRPKYTSGTVSLQETDWLCANITYTSDIIPEECEFLNNENWCILYSQEHVELWSGGIQICRKVGSITIACINLSQYKCTLIFILMMHTAMDEGDLFLASAYRYPASSDLLKTMILFTSLQDPSPRCVDWSGNCDHRLSSYECLLLCGAFIWPDKKCWSSSIGEKRFIHCNLPVATIHIL